MRSRSFIVLVTLTCLAVPASVDAKDVSPTKAYGILVKKMRRVRDAEAKKAQMKTAAEAYLEEWAASGRKAGGKHLYSLALFQQAAERFADAAKGFRAVQGDKTVKDRTRDLAATNEANLLLEPALRSTMGAGLEQATTHLCKYAAAMAGDPARQKNHSNLRYVLAKVHDAAGRRKDGHDMRMQIVADDPGYLSKVYGLIMRGMLSSNHAIGGYDALRKEGAAVMKTLTDIQSGIIAEKKAALDKARAKLMKSNPGALDGDTLSTSASRKHPDVRSFSSAERSFKSADTLLQRIKQYEQPLGMLGKPVEAWTLEKAFGDIKAVGDLKGKVVVLNFWGTWCAPCISGLPVLRQIAREYKDKGLVVVGVTVSHNVCYEERYALDGDMRSKAEPGARPVYAARLSSERAPVDPSQSILDETEYRAVELEAVGAFMKNHEMNWPVVMIDKAEPGPKYALGIWPHTLVLDREGRIRHFQRGEMRPGDTVSVAAFRKVLDDVVAETR